MQPSRGYFVAHVAVYKCLYSANKLSSLLLSPFPQSESQRNCVSATILFHQPCDLSWTLPRAGVSGIFTTFLWQRGGSEGGGAVGTGICPNNPLTNRVGAAVELEELEEVVDEDRTRRNGAVTLSIKQIQRRPLFLDRI